MKQKKFYTYRIGWSKLNLYYYGVRTNNKWPPEDDFWKQYFTSSPNVELLREAHGDPDIIEIRQRFNERRRAQYWEREVIARHAYHHPDYLNGMKTALVSAVYC